MGLPLKLHVLQCGRGERIRALALAVSSILIKSCQNQITEYLSNQRQANDSSSNSSTNRSDTGSSNNSSDSQQLVGAVWSPIWA